MTFDDCLRRVLVHEGGYSNHPADPGGATNKGITQRVYDAWRSMKGLRRRSVRNILPEEVSEIYFAQYWVPLRASHLPPGVAYCAFDAAVNSGVRRASIWLQRAVGVEPDGTVGVVTLRAAQQKHPPQTVNRLCDDRMAFLRRLSTWPTFGVGWTRRVRDVRTTALAATRTPAPPPPHAA